MMAILHDKINVAKVVNVKMITFDEGPRRGWRVYEAAYFEFRPAHRLAIKAFAA